MANLQEKLVKLTADLIGFRSSYNFPEEKVRVMDFCEKYLREQSECELFFERFNVNGQESMVVTNQSGKKPKVMLYSHLDVVPAEKEEYEVRMENGRIYGRGAGDMKSAAAVVLQLFKDKAATTKYALGLMLTTDEELGGIDGVRYLLDDAGYSCDLAIVPDSVTGVDTIVTNQKGILHAEIWAEGKAAHGSRPFLGENAIEKLMREFARLKMAFPAADAQKWERTINIGKIEGGNQVNQVPDFARAQVDMRYVAPHEKGEIVAALESLDGGYKIKIDAPAFYISEKDKMLQKYAAVVEKVTGKGAVFAGEEGGSDARFFTKYKIPAIVSGIKKGNSHSIDEWADIAEIEEFYLILEEFLADLS